MNAPGKTPCGACAAQRAYQGAELPPDGFAFAWLLGWAAGSRNPQAVILCPMHSQDLTRIARAMGSEIVTVPAIAVEVPPGAPTPTGSGAPS